MKTSHIGYSTNIGISIKNKFGYKKWDRTSAAVCEYLQYNENRKMILAAYRGWGKTEGVNVAFAEWKMMRNLLKSEDDETKCRYYSIMYVGADAAFAQNNLGSFKKAMESNEILAPIRPTNYTQTQMIQLGRKNTAKYIHTFDNQESKPNLIAKGIISNLSGHRANLIIGDDLEGNNNSSSAVKRDVVFKNVKEFNHICDLNYGGESEIVLLGTFHAKEDSLYKKLVEECGYDIYCFPKLIPTKEQSKSIMRLHPLYQELQDLGAKPGDIIAPYRNSLKSIAEDMSVGDWDFSTQTMMMHKALGGDNNSLSIEDFIIFDKFSHTSTPNWLEWGKIEERVVGDFSDQSESIDWDNEESDDYEIKSNVAFIEVDSEVTGNFYYATNNPYSFSKPERRIAYIDPSADGDDETVLAIGYLNNKFYFIDDVFGIGGKLSIGNHSGASDETFRILIERCTRKDVEVIYVECVWSLVDVG